VKKHIKTIISYFPFLKGIAIFFIKLKLKRSYQVKFGTNVYINNSVICEGRNSFSDNSSIAGSYIGYASYIGINTSIVKSKIGKYCSIGSNVRCIFGNHPTKDFVSTHPAFFSTLKQAGFSYTKVQLFKEIDDAFNKENEYSITIGNDVWIGDGAAIMAGVSIGDGAIIAANALVVKNVPPFSIVGGVPAKVIRNRFSTKETAFLKDFKWWDKDTKWLQNNAHLFVNIDNFYNTLKNEK